MTTVLNIGSVRYAPGVTAFPAGITTGSTWDTSLMYARGNALGMFHFQRREDIPLKWIMNRHGIESAWSSCSAGTRSWTAWENPSGRIRNALERLEAEQYRLEGIGKAFRMIHICQASL
jgi:hypothetical protein